MVGDAVTTITCRSCPACGAPLGFLPGTLAVRCGACGSVAHVAEEVLGPRLPGTIFQRVAQPVTAAGVDRVAIKPAETTETAGPGEAIAAPQRSDGPTSLEAARAAHKQCAAIP
jgi:LSD1 subclass zinc finger protein